MLGISRQSVTLLSLSLEANFLLLLGDRAGTRIVPATVSQDALGYLYADLRSSSDAAATVVLGALERIFTQIADGPPGRLRRETDDAGLALGESFAADTAAGRCLSALECADLAAEDLRLALAFSITLRAILRAGLLPPREGNSGAATIIRSRGVVEPAQSDMRLRVSAALGKRAATLKSPTAHDVERYDALRAKDLRHAS